VKTFLHSGDMGDIVYALPTIRAMGGGVLYLDTSGGGNDPFVNRQLGSGWHLKFNDTCYNFLKPLIEAQPYIHGVEKYVSQKINVNLNGFRTRLRADNQENLAQSHLKYFNLDLSDKEIIPWIEVPDSGRAPVREIVVNRSLRYHTAYIMWVTLAGMCRDKAEFVGTPFEHEVFSKTFEIDIPYYPCENALVLAQRLKDARYFIGNQSMPMSVRIGLGLPFAQESYIKCPNCIFDGISGRYTFN